METKETPNREAVFASSSNDLLGAARYFKIGDSVTDGGKIGTVEEIYESIVVVDWGMWQQNCHYSDLDLSD